MSSAPLPHFEKISNNYSIYRLFFFIPPKTMVMVQTVAPMAQSWQVWSGEVMGSNTELALKERVWENRMLGVSSIYRRIWIWIWLCVSLSMCLCDVSMQCIHVSTYVSTYLSIYFCIFVQVQRFCWWPKRLRSLSPALGVFGAAGYYLQNAGARHQTARMIAPQAPKDSGFQRQLTSIHGFVVLKTQLKTDFSDSSYN